MNERLYNDLLGRKWFDAVAICIHDFRRYEFSLQEFMATYGDVLQRTHPENNSVGATVRRVVQELRDAEVIEFVDNNGNYRCADFINEELISEINFSGFNLELTPKPNAPSRELVWREGQQAFHSPFAQEHKKKIGRAGEMAVIETEIRSLTMAGRKDLAKKVEHVAETRGDDAGFDVLSYDNYENEKWIEVKTTTGHAGRRFHISENQVATSEKEPKKYWLYRLYHFQTGSMTASYYQMQGALRSQLDLRVTEYSALPN